MSHYSTIVWTAAVTSPPTAESTTSTGLAPTTTVGTLTAGVTTTSTPTPVRVQGTSTVPWLPVVALIVAVAALAWQMGRRLNRQTSVGTNVPDSVNEPSTQRYEDPQALDQLGAQRLQLIEGLVDLRDRIDSRSLSDRVGRILDQVGVRTVDPTGTPFNPRIHRAEDSRPTADPALDQHVAEVVTYGYEEPTPAGNPFHRLPGVVVFRYSADEGSR